MTRRTGRIARIDPDLDRLRRRLLDQGLADGLTDVDKIMTKELEKIFCKEKKRDRDDDPLGGWF